MSNVRGWVGALWMVLLGAGCTVNLDFDALADGDAGAPRDDAGDADTDSVAVRDSSVRIGDASRVTIGPVGTTIVIEDGGVPADPAPSDGGSPSDAGPSQPFCTTRDAAFCDDFEAPPLAARWVGYGSWQTALSNDQDATTGARTALLTMPVGVPPNEDAIFAYLSKSLQDMQSKPAAIQVDFDLKIEKTAASAKWSAIVFLLALESPGKVSNEYLLSVRSAGSDSYAVLELAENGMPANPDDSTIGLYRELPCSLGTWQHISFLLHAAVPPGARAVAGADNRLTVTIDGNTELDEKLKHTLQSSRPSVNFGITKRSPSDPGPWRLRFDNVEVNLKPL